MQVERLAAAGLTPCGTQEAVPFSAAQKFSYVSCKNVRNVKIEVVRTEVLLLFSIKLSIQKEAFINFSPIFFSKWRSKLKGK